MQHPVVPSLVQLEEIATTVSHPPTETRARSDRRPGGERGAQQVAVERGAGCHDDPGPPASKVAEPMTPGAPEPVTVDRGHHDDFRISKEAVSAATGVHPQRVVDDDESGCRAVGLIE